MSRPKAFLLGIAGAIAVAVGILVWFDRQDRPTIGSVRLLAYVGYEETEFIQPIEAAIGAKVSVDTYAGGEDMYTKFTTAPRGTYDVVVLDAEYGEKLFKAGLLVAQDTTLWKYNDLFTKFRDGAPGKSGSSVYAVAARWGALGIVFNTQRVDSARLKSYDRGARVPSGTGGAWHDCQHERQG